MTPPQQPAKPSNTMETAENSGDDTIVDAELQKKPPTPTVDKELGVQHGETNKNATSPEKTPNPDKDEVVPEEVSTAGKNTDTPVEPLPEATETRTNDKLSTEATVVEVLGTPKKPPPVIRRSPRNKKDPPGNPTPTNTESPTKKSTDGRRSTRLLGKRKGDPIEEEYLPSAVDCSENEEEEQEESNYTTPVKGSSVSKRKYTKRFSSDSKWTDEDGRTMFYKNEVDKILIKIAHQEFGGTSFNKLKFRSEAYKPVSGTNCRRRIHKCGCAHYGGCAFVLEEMYDVESRMTYFRCSDIPHSGHELVDLKKRGMPPVIKKVLDSPNMLRMKPELFVQRVIKKTGVTMTGALSRKIKDWYKDVRHEYNADFLELAEPHTFGSLAETFENFKKSRMSSCNNHTIYLVDDAWTADSSTGDYWAVFSSDHLLLNAYRQWYNSHDIIIYVDTSYRYTWEGAGIMPIMTASPCQSGHHIAYALCSTESTECHEKVLEILKRGVEEVVNRKIEEGVTAI